jgi:hypothetical protein
MLPKFLQSSYTRYKDDTNSFAAWLLEAATKCGYQPDDLVSSTTRLRASKGKYKSKKRESGAASDPIQYTTTIKDLQVLAEVIAKSTLTVPTAVLLIAKRAIKLRKQVTSWFLGQGDLESNKHHEHFVSALEKVCETLEWKINKSPNPDIQQQPPVSKVEDGDADLNMFLNRFTILNVEDPQETQPEHTVSPESQKIIKVELVENDREEEPDSYFGHMFFKAFCLFRDLHNMRTFISHTWTEYRDKKIDLMNAAVVTDSALRLARDLVQEVVDDWAAFDSRVDSLQELVFTTSSIKRGILPTPSIEIGLPYNKDMADVAEWCYLPTLVLLRSFAGILQDEHFPVFKKGHFGTYEPKANRENMSVGQKFNEDKILLLQLLPEFRMVESFDIPMLASDAITEGLVGYCKSKNATLWHCFASQILLDVHHIVRYSKLGAFEDLRMSGLRIQRIIEDYWKVSRTHPDPPFWPKEGEEEIQQLHDGVESWIIHDPFYALKASMFPGKQAPEENVLFSQHAILCGLHMFHFNLRMQSIGQQLVTQWYDVQQLAFLYNLVKQAVHKHLNWPDMETFIKIHGESHIFIGGRPKNASESLNRLELATGISSATNFARDSRRNEDFHRPSGKSRRLLKPTTTIANLFRVQYVGGLGAGEGIASIDRVLDKLLLESESDRKATRKDLRASNPQEILQQKWTHTHNIGTIQVLALIKRKLFEEEPLILFNYFGMHQRSLELLRQIRDKEHHKFVQYFTASYMPHEFLITIIVILIHHVARGSAQDARDMGFTSRDSDKGIGSRIIISSGDVMQKYLEKNGDVACKELRIFCKNKTPIQEVARDEKGRSEEFVFWTTFEDIVGPKVIASLQTGIPVA